MERGMEFAQALRVLSLHGGQGDVQPLKLVLAVLLLPFLEHGDPADFIDKVS
jgi:hypothetical protein